MTGILKLDALTSFGLVAVTLMLLTYALKQRSNWFILAFAGACLLGSSYGFLQGEWPFGAVEAVWGGRCSTLVAGSPDISPRRRAILLHLQKALN
jgi:hypothetical protein